MISSGGIACAKLLNSPSPDALHIAQLLVGYDRVIHHACLEEGFLTKRKRERLCKKEFLRAKSRYDAAGIPTADGYGTLKNGPALIFSPTDLALPPDTYINVVGLDRRTRELLFYDIVVNRCLVAVLDSHGGVGACCIFFVWAIVGSGIKILM